MADVRGCGAQGSGGSLEGVAPQHVPCSVPALRVPGKRKRTPQDQAGHGRRGQGRWPSQTWPFPLIRTPTQASTSNSKGTCSE